MEFMGLELGELILFAGALLLLLSAASMSDKSTGASALPVPASCGGAGSALAGGGRVSATCRENVRMHVRMHLRTRTDWLTLA